MSKIAAEPVYLDDELPRCPRCFMPLGKGNAAEGQIKGTLGRHINTTKCDKHKSTTDAILRVVGQKPPVAPDKSDDADEQTALEEARDRLGLDADTVVFESPNSQLKVLLKRGRQIRDSSNNLVDMEPAVYACFNRGRYVTDDEWTIGELRKSRSNMAVLKRKGLEGAALLSVKGRFFEVQLPSTTG